ncbi:MAG: conjugal transfer protein TrbE [Gammaproteobacteria bacterium GWF2_41_13]|nr:MAG: conjugal transfer protein TrbE [Gammaproteobacteria bacterium GWF2_41_13]
MFNLSEYQQKPDKLSDLLPWAAMIAPGIILNKDGSLQRTIKFRGPDLESSTEPQLVSATARLNNAIKRFGSGWAITIEARRIPYKTTETISAFPDPVSLMIDAENRERLKQTEQYFESHYFITLQYLAPARETSKLTKLFFNHSADIQDNFSKNSDYFTATTERFFDILKDFMFEISFLNDEETLTYLHSTISTKHHPVRMPETPMYLDATLADTPLLAGIEPKLGDHYLKIISILGFPSSTFPALLDQLNQLPIEYRWVTRFLPLDKSTAENELKKYKRKWFAKRKNVMNMLQEVFTRTESQLVDTAALEKAKDADEALQELSADYVSYGYYTATVTVSDKDVARAIEKQREIERVINGLGFTTIAETFNAVEAWLSSLPGHAYANVRTPLLHSLNLSHLLPFSSIWSGFEKDMHLNQPPLMTVNTYGRTPFRLSQYIGDVGHQLVIGPTGAGKSVYLNMAALQFRRYPKAQIFIFDKGGSFMASTLGVGGGYHPVGDPESGLTFQPLSSIDQENERIWAAEWLQGLLMNEQVKITPDVKQAVWEALTSLSKMPIHQRTLTGLNAVIQNTHLRMAFATYTLSGPYGHLLDADHEKICDESWQCYEIEQLISMPSIIPPVLSYLFHRLEKRFTGEPTLLILDEGWLYLDHPMFANKIRDWLKTLRKHNVAVIFATQSAEDALATTLAPVLLESCSSRVLLPHDRILEPNVKASYEKLGLNDRQLQILANSTPKRQYYYQSRFGNRLFELELGPIAFAFAAASSPEDKQMIKLILRKEGIENFLAAYLHQKHLSWIIE